jgi:hypothetical protein
MVSRWPLLLPLVAILSVAAAAVVVLDSRSPGNAPAQLQVDLPIETPQVPAARVEQAGSVCQGIVRRPDPGEPRIFHPTYTTQREVLGFIVVGNEAVDERAFDVAVKTIEDVFSRNNLKHSLVEEGAYIIIADPQQGVLDLPEFACLERQLGAAFFTHVCGVADRADYPVATVNQLDLLGDRSGPCRGKNILYHELGHLVQGWTLEHADYIEVRLLYQAALDAGKYAGEYAATNPNEYFAEGTQAFFTERGSGDSRNRDWLRRYDPDLFNLLQQIYGD